MCRRRQVGNLLRWKLAGSPDNREREREREREEREERDPRGTREKDGNSRGTASGRQIKMLFAAGGLIKRGPVAPTGPTTDRYANNDFAFCRVPSSLLLRPYASVYASHKRGRPKCNQVNDYIGYTRVRTEYNRDYVNEFLRY